MDRKATARETLAIMDRGYYEINGIHVDIRERQADSVKRSFLLTPEQGKHMRKVQKHRTGRRFLQQRTVLQWMQSCILSQKENLRRF